MKCLLDIQKDIRNIENSMVTIQANIKQVNDDIDALRNKDNNIDFDYDEINKMSQCIPFKTHPICRMEDKAAVQLYLMVLLNIVKLDDKSSEDKIDTRLVFIQWLLNKSKLDITLEDLIVESFKFKISDYDKLTSRISTKYREFLVVDLLIVANMSGTFNEDECNYVVDMLAVLGMGTAKFKILSIIAKLVLCQKAFEFDSSLGNELVKELGNYRHYVLSNVNTVVDSVHTDIIKEVVRAMRMVVVDIPYDKAINFKWKSKQNEKVVKGAVIATYQVPKRKRGYSFSTEYTTKEILAPADGTIFQFRDSNIIYGIISHETDDKDSIKQWIKQRKG